MPLFLRSVMAGLSALSAIILIAHFATGSISAFEGSAILLMLGASFLSPRSALLALILIGPICGNRPGTSQAEFLLLLSIGFQLGTAPRLWRDRESLSAVGVSRGMLLLLAYCVASALSLSGVPFSDWVRELYASTPSLKDASSLLYLVHGWSISTEDRLPYIGLSVLWTFYSLQAALVVFSLVRRDEREGAVVLTSVSVSLLVALVVGILDYYSAIDLRILRALDPVVNPGDVQFRLQSWFGHSGWFAEFVTLAIPSTMVLLLAPLSFRARVAGLVCLLLLGEFALILTFQRGGWLSYPLTLLVVWAAIYVTRRLERGEVSVVHALKKSTIKILLSLPITVIASFAALMLLSQLHAVGSAGNVDLSVYLSRAKDISKAGDRTEFMHAGALLGSERPILGGGSESFAYHFQREFENPSGKFFDQIRLPLHGTAHNVYLQTFAGKGLVGCGLLLSLLLFLIISPVRRVLSADEGSTTSRVILLSCAASGAAFAIYGNVQEVFYVQTLQYLFFVILAAASALLVRGVQVPQRILIKGLSGLLLGAAALQVVWMYVYPAKALKRAAAFERFGCYREETDGEGAFRWCGPRGSINVPVAVKESDGSRVAALRVAGPPPFPGSSSGALLLEAEGVSLGQWEIVPGRTRLIEIPVTTSGDGLTLDFEIGTGVLPVRDLPPSKDRRFLSFKFRK